MSTHVDHKSDDNSKKVEGNLEALWAQWTLFPSSDNSLENMSISDPPPRQIKLEIYSSILAFYHQESNDKMFKRRWEELHHPKVLQTPLGARLASAIKGKESANEKYKNNNWFGAMYVYALAWGCMIPYNLDTLSQGDSKKKEIAILECAIWSNIAACAITASDDDKTEVDQKQVAVKIGIRAARCCLDMQGYATIGIITKACNRGITLRGKVAEDQREQTVSAEEVEKWKNQVKNLEGLNDKSSFGEVAEEKKVI